MRQQDAELEVLEQLEEARRVLDLALGGRLGLAEAIRSAMVRVGNASLWPPTIEGNDSHNRRPTLGSVRRPPDADT